YRWERRRRDRSPIDSAPRPGRARRRAAMAVHTDAHERRADRSPDDDHRQFHTAIIFRTSAATRQTWRSGEPRGRVVSSRRERPAAVDARLVRAYADGGDPAAERRA